jgi:hypothetical protein
MVLSLIQALKGSFLDAEDGKGRHDVVSYITVPVSIEGT